jgi:hypothetical protein
MRRSWTSSAPRIEAHRAEGKQLGLLVLQIPRVEQI